jgi:hypothetical protein
VSNYERPEVLDYGTVVEITEATGFTGAEDGGSKLLIHHSGPALP